jgi:hypothetical protein
MELEVDRPGHQIKSTRGRAVTLAFPSIPFDRQEFRSNGKRFRLMENITYG